MLYSAAITVRESNFYYMYLILNTCNWLIIALNFCIGIFQEADVRLVVIGPAPHKFIKVSNSQKSINGQEAQNCVIVSWTWTAKITG